MSATPGCFENWTFSVKVILTLKAESISTLVGYGGTMSTHVSGVVGVPFKHTYPASMTQFPLHPSPSIVFPSSHSLMPRFLLSPHSSKQSLSPFGGARNPGISSQGLHSVPNKTRAESQRVHSSAPGPEQSAQVVSHTERIISTYIRNMDPERLQGILPWHIPA